MDTVRGKADTKTEANPLNKRDNGHLLRIAAAVSGTALVLTLAAAGEMFRRRAIKGLERRRRGRLLRSRHREGTVSQTPNKPAAAITVAA